jgi:hypothetical protein
VTHGTCSCDAHSHADGDKLEVIGSLSFALAEVFETDSMDFGMYDTVDVADPLATEEVVVFEVSVFLFLFLRVLGRKSVIMYVPYFSTSRRRVEFFSSR